MDSFQPSSSIIGATATLCGIEDLDILALLRHHPIPNTDCDCSDIQNYIESGEREVDCIDAQLESSDSEDVHGIPPNSTMLLLRERKDFIRLRVYQCKAFFAPVRKLPSGVLLRILQYAMPASDSNAPSSLPSSPLMRVCHRWRSILIKSEQLLDGTRIVNDETAASFVVEPKTLAPTSNSERRACQSPIITWSPRASDAYAGLTETWVFASGMLVAATH